MKRNSEGLCNFSFIAGSSAFCAMAILSCSAEPSVETVCTDTQSNALIGATADAGLESIASTIGRLYVPTSAANGYSWFSTCTVVQVRPDWVLSAAHCLKGDEPGLGFVSFNVDQRGQQQHIDCVGAWGVGDWGVDDRSSGVRVTHVHKHPERDVMLMSLEERRGVSMPIGTAAITIDSELVMAGYGVRSDGSSGVLEFLQATVLEISRAHIRVSAGEGRGACVGDSGGPLFRIHSDRSAEVVGILSSGSPTCVGYDDYVRADSLKQWLEQVLD